MIDDFKRKIDSRIEQFLYFKDDSNCKSIFDAIQRIADSLEKGNKILVFGNGGSATQSSHLAAELVNKFYHVRKPIPAIALVVDIANLTSIANDSDYKYVFSRQVEALGKKGDIALGLTTSGRSLNVLEALKLSKQIGLETIAMCGNNPESLENLGIDTIITVPTSDTPVIQELHLFILHTMAEMLEKKQIGVE
jgi:D-sedoheptulose 7-phosphate isomerase